MDTTDPADHQAHRHANTTQLLQEARQCFMATSVRTKKLVDVLTKCIFILLRGERLSPAEATDLFFHMTRLFQYNDSTLRRLTYIGIKALSKQAENVYVVTSSLTNDVDSFKEDPVLRASALRALCQISDASALTTIERSLKQSILDKNPVVASAALSSLIRVAPVNSEIIKRCSNEIQEALNSESPMAQYHALTLSYEICKNDRLTVSKLIGNCKASGLKSPLAICLLIKIIHKHIDEYKPDDARDFIQCIEDYLEHPSDMVEYEAANALANLPRTLLSNFEIPKKSTTSAIGHLRNFLTSSKPILRFAAVRSLNKLSATSTTRYWSIHNIANTCKLHLLNKTYRVGDQIIGILDFSNSSKICVKYTVILQCDDTKQYAIEEEFSLGLKKNSFMIIIPPINTEEPVQHGVLSFIFHIADEGYSKTISKDASGTVELGPKELDTKLFSCGFPIAIQTG